MIFAVHDFETTGLRLHYLADPTLQPRAIEFGAILTDGVNILDQMEFICNPEIQIEEIITNITGLTNEDLECQNPFEHYIPAMAKFFSGAGAIISHNLSFDRGIMSADLSRYGKTLADVNWPKIEICTVEQTYEIFGRRMKLSELYNRYVGEYVQKHRALDDVLLLHEVCKATGVYDAFKERVE